MDKEFILALTLTCTNKRDHDIFTNKGKNGKPDTMFLCSLFWKFLTITPTKHEQEVKQHN